MISLQIESQKHLMTTRLMVMDCPNCTSHNVCTLPCLTLSRRVISPMCLILFPPVIRPSSNLNHRALFLQEKDRALLLTIYLCSQKFAFWFDVKTIFLSLH